MKFANRVPGPLLGILLAGLAGCATTRTVVPAASVASNAPAVALLVRVAGGGRTLSPRELSTIQEALQGYITDAGFRFARNADAADLFVTVRFTPDSLDPKGGLVAVTAIEPNPMKRRRVVGDEISPEAQEMRQKVRDLERLINGQSKSS